MRKKYRDQARDIEDSATWAAMDFGTKLHLWYYHPKFKLWVSECGYVAEVDRLAFSASKPQCKNCQRWINYKKVA